MKKYRARKAMIKDIDQLVKLVRDCFLELYPDRKVSGPVPVRFTVQRWIDTPNFDIIVIDDGEGELLGFTTGAVNNFDMLLEPFYLASLAYIVPEHRKGKATYLLYKWMSDNAKRLGLVLEAIALNDLAFSHLKKFGGKEMGKHVVTHQFVKENN